VTIFTLGFRLFFYSAANKQQREPNKQSEQLQEFSLRRHTQVTSAPFAARLS
jgi:hypothetical protein